MTREKDGLKVAALFAGIGGIEVGLERAGHETILLSEWDEAAQRVLRHRFPDTRLEGDVADIEELPEVDVVTAGFPCQDLSQAGRTAGITGSRSGLVGHVFRLLDQAAQPPTWLVLENVSFMLSLDRGKAMHWLTSELERRGYSWAYRVVDSQAFGLPQRRQRVLLVASQTEDPRPVLFNQNEEPPVPGDHRDYTCGFYWTEGLRGLGWAVDAVPTLKGGSTIGIPSPPAIWRPGSGHIGTPDLRDAERLQGFDEDWTIAAAGSVGSKKNQRWKLVGNAVSVPVAEWLGTRLGTDEAYVRDADGDRPLAPGTRWPKAAWGMNGERRQVDVTMWPVVIPRESLADFLRHETKPLSVRATTGFVERATRGTLNMPDTLIHECVLHIERMTRRAQLAMV